VSLRETLLEHADREIELVGHERLSLRALAANAGVAPSAPYRHFKDRSALLHALADIGFVQLIEGYSRARALNASPQDQLKAAIEVFLNLAKNRPNLFHLMFTSDTLTGADNSGLSWKSFEIFEILVSNSLEIDLYLARISSVSLWSALHGAAILHRTGQINAHKFGITLEDVISDIASRYSSKSTLKYF